MDDSVNPASISWDRNDTKRAADQMAFRGMAYDLHHMGRSGKRIRVLSFPGATWLWEQSLAEAFPGLRMQFRGLERNPKVWKRSARMADALTGRFQLHREPTGFREYVTGDPYGKRARFDLIYLDWMGTWSREKKEDLDALFRNGGRLNAGGLLLFTISLRRGRPETMAELEDMSYDLPLTFYDARGKDRYVSNLKVRGIPHWVCERAREHRVELRPIMANVYYSNSGGNQCQPQLQLLFLHG